MFTQWLQSTGAEKINEEIIQFKELKEKKQMIENRPKVWSDVIFRPIPHQEGEVGIDNASDKKNEEYKPIFDPLGLDYHMLIISS